jgi:hypothetical protein
MTIASQQLAQRRPGGTLLSLAHFRRKIFTAIIVV